MNMKIRKAEAAVTIGNVMFGVNRMSPDCEMYNARGFRSLVFARTAANFFYVRHFCFFYVRPREVRP